MTSSEPDPARRTLLVFADSLAYYGPTGGLPSDDPRIWPNLVAGRLGWDLELIGRIGWTCRDVWWAATQDPRSWAALPHAGNFTLGLAGAAVAFAAINVVGGYVVTDRMLAMFHAGQKKG